MLSGCAVGPDYRAPSADAPPDWTAWHGGDPALARSEQRQSADIAPASRWWEVFGDAKLNDLQARALAANLDLQTAALRFAQSRVQRQTVAAQRGPLVNGSAGVSRQRQSESGAATRMIDVIAPASRDALVKLLSEPYSLYQAGFDASWEPDLWGRVRRSIEAADANVTASAAALDGLRLIVSAEVARAYFELRGQQSALRLTRADLSAANEFLDLVRVRAQRGLATELDVARQRALLAALRSRLPLLLDQEAQTLNRLTLLLGERPGALQADLAGLAVTGSAPVLPDLTLGIPAELARFRPDIRQAEARLHAATAGIGIAIASLYPRIVLGASFGMESTRSGELDTWGSRMWKVGPSLTLPLFDRGRRRGEITLRELEQQEAAVAYQQAVLQAWHEIDTALSAYSAQRQRNQELAARETNSRDAYELAHARYENGLIPYLEDLDAQRAWLQAQQERADSDTSMAVLLVSVCKALGGSVKD